MVRFVPGSFPIRTGVSKKGVSFNISKLELVARGLPLAHSLSHVERLNANGPHKGRIGAHGMKSKLFPLGIALLLLVSIMMAGMLMVPK